MTEKILDNKPNPWKKIGMLLLFIVGGILIVYLTPLGAYLKNINQVRIDIEKAGVWSFLIFIVIFVVTSLLSIPGTGWLFLACIVYSEVWIGGVLTYVAAFLAAIATFYMGRLMGGGALSGIKNTRVRSLIASAEKNPIRTIIIMRSVLLLSPLVGFALALTNMKPRDYIIGSLIGLMVPVAVLSIAIFFIRDEVFRFFGIDG
jgi:uncharacterized membrane protein YdjX (TVP38/TMEM64 family)